MSSPEETDGKERFQQGAVIDDDLFIKMLKDVDGEFDRFQSIQDIRSVAEYKEMKVVQRHQGLRDIFSQLQSNNQQKVKTLEHLHTVRNARQLAGDIFIEVSEMGVHVVEDEELIKMRLQLQTEAAEQEAKMSKLEKEMLEEENRVSIRQNQLLALSTDINLRKQFCNEMAADSKRIEAEKTELLNAIRSHDMTGVRARLTRCATAAIISS